MAKSEDKPESLSRPTRPYWKGYLRLALVTIPVQIHTATESSKVALNQIHKPSGQRVNYTVTAGGQEVDPSEVVKGYPIAEDTFVTLEPEELDAVKLESKKTLDLKEFVKAEEIAPPFFERPYYIVPQDEFAVGGLPGHSCRAEEGEAFRPCPNRHEQRQGAPSCRRRS